MRFGFYLPTRGPGTDPDSITSLVQHGERVVDPDVDGLLSNQPHDPTHVRLPWQRHALFTRGSGGPQGPGTSPSWNQGTP